ncbi:lipocalin family protein [Nocardia sp. alder85J]|uniref:lipocalin family protein n=1 Tax=Nocardia sp. alder85J TaxID=2862949 RepID=UPI001CD29453|nr:lipocalin family protein [Nocardia sp. alder85J]MCX4091605.1 hypothetical protein [Nocardia sp. alder85J]
MRRSLSMLLVMVTAGVAAWGIPVARVAAEAPPLSLPADEGPHSSAVEWWYFVGDLTGTDATGDTEEFGTLLTFSRVAGVTVSDFELTDLTTGAHYSEGHAAAPSEAALPGGGFRIDDGDWGVHGVGGSYELRGASQSGADAITLETSSAEPAALEGRDGVIRPYGTVGSTSYYSWTDLRMNGTVRHDGRTFTVSGAGWSDHQWFDPDPGGMARLSWDWFAVQLTDGRQYMIYLTRDHGGPIVNPAGNLIRPGGRSVPLDPAGLAVHALGSWTSPDTGKTYSSGWQVSVPGGTFTITARQPNQESAQLLTPPASYRMPQLWEGVCSVTGTIDGRPVTGRSFTEILPPTM